MEDLGIPRKAFLELQEAAVKDVQIARNSLSNFAGLLDSHALGKAFSLSYLMRSLEGIGCELGHRGSLKTVGTPFLRGLVDTAVLSVLRGLKHNARIPVPQGWNLVGIADESGTLGPGEIYGVKFISSWFCVGFTFVVLACVWEQDMEQPTFLRGPIMISRSPTVHPGDVQMVNVHYLCVCFQD